MRSCEPKPRGHGGCRHSRAFPRAISLPPGARYWRSLSWSLDRRHLQRTFRARSALAALRWMLLERQTRMEIRSLNALNDSLRLAPSGKGKRPSVGSPTGDSLCKGHSVSSWCEFQSAYEHRQSTTKCDKARMSHFALFQDAWRLPNLPVSTSAGSRWIEKERKRNESPRKRRQLCRARHSVAKTGLADWARARRIYRRSRYHVITLKTPLHRGWVHTEIPA